MINSSMNESINLWSLLWSSVYSCHHYEDHNNQYRTRKKIMIGLQSWLVNYAEMRSKEGDINFIIIVIWKYNLVNFYFYLYKCEGVCIR